MSVYARLSKFGLDIFPIPIEDEIKELPVGRVFLSKQFGGSSVRAFPTINPKRFKEHGFNKLMYIPLVSTGRPQMTVTSRVLTSISYPSKFDVAYKTLHPHAPSIPGAQGLWMCCTSGRWSDDNMRVVVRVETKPLALWQYMGRMTSGPVTHYRSKNG